MIVTSIYSLHSQLQRHLVDLLDCTFISFCGETLVDDLMVYRLY